MTPQHTQKRPTQVSFSEYSSPTTSLGIIGLGYVGLPLSILAASKGFRVVGFDIDEVKVAQLLRREASFLRPDEAERFKQTPSLSISAEERALDGLDTFIVCVPTPVKENHLPDLGPLESACAIVGRHLKRGALVVIESTVSPGVCEEAALPVLERSSGLSRDEFHFAHCPERINPGDAEWDVRTIPRVMGALTDEALDRAYRLYSDLLETEIVRMGSIKEAEAVKMVENAFRDINIAFVNELAISFDKAGIDLVNVIRGASTKPFGFMPFYPGCGVGGHCIPVDPYYLIRYGEKNGFEHRFLIAARQINSKMPLYTVSVLERAFKEKRKRMSSSVVTILGLAYKSGIPDTRESPALVIRDALLRKGVAVRTYDPYVAGTARRLEDALEGTHAVVIATDHEEFLSLTPREFERHGVEIVIDGRNSLDKNAFRNSRVLYRGIGH
jgi:UDP-N-acetyl-D-glucosamine dehydrogenase